MADFTSRNDASLPPAALKPKRSGPNVNSSWVIMVLSALIAMVVFFVLTSKTTEKVTVAVAADDISTGAQVSDRSFRPLQVSLTGEALSRVILYQDRGLYSGYTSAGPIAKGDLMLKTQLRQSSTSNGLNAMSIPVDITHAVGGELAIGDRVDVFDEESGEYAAQNLEVIAVNRGTGGGALSSSQGFHIIVALNADEAASVGEALKGAKIDVVRATGGSSPSRNSSSAARGTNANSSVTSSTSTTSTTAR